MSIRIMVLADDDIESVSSEHVMTRLRQQGIKARRTRITRLTAKQYEKALAN